MSKLLINSIYRYFLKMAEQGYARDQMQANDTLIILIAVIDAIKCFLLRK